MTKIAVLTSFVTRTGLPEDHLYDIKHDTADYYFFTNNEDHEVPEGWNKRILYPCSLDKPYENRRAGKIPKQLAHLLLPDYDYYIWHDYFHFINEDPLKIVELIGDADMGLFSHPTGRSWLEEIGAAAPRDHPQKMEATVRAFRDDLKIPLDRHLWELSCFIRKNSEKANKCCGLWNELTTLLTSRDQVSFIAAEYLTSPSICTLPGTALAYGGNNTLITHKGRDLVSLPGVG